MSNGPRPQSESDESYENDMPKRVYVHIGLPKTATTTLQLDYFPHVNNDEYFYLGVFQPRAQKVQDPLFLQIISAARSGDGLEEVSQALTERLEVEQRSLIISEEMLTVGSAEVTWQEQLSNLSKILSGIDHKVLVTVREPVSAMFSFYVELYDRFQKKGLPFSELALHDNDFGIYHYDGLLEVLSESFDPACVHLQSFESLVKANFSATFDFLDNPTMEAAFSSLKNHNKKKKTKSAVMIPKRLKLQWVTRLYHRLGGEQNRFAVALKWIAKKPLQKLRSISFKSVPVPILADNERQELAKEMAGTMDVMAERFGVRY
ncbi:MAG: hypothetical protein R3208_17680 [Ketobacteraceae bacterium]|nr:hypothetical protein [Ketobacteraceae bacterium]